MSKILVTGASSGVGLAITEALLEAGHTVWGVSRRLNNHDAKDYNHTQLDLSDAKAVEQVCRTTFSKRDFDALVYCAGVGVFGYLEQLSSDAFQANMQVNCLSAMIMAKALIPSMKKRQSGKMIFIGSEAALQGAKQGGLYCATKFALRGFTQSLAQELRSSNIGVTLVNPGALATAFHDQTHFAPSSEQGCTIDTALLTDTVLHCLSQQASGFISEINLEPYKHVIVKR